MATQEVKHKLTAILIVYVKEDSRLMGKMGGGPWEAPGTRRGSRRAKINLK